MSPPLWFYREIDLNILMRLCPFNNNNNKRERESSYVAKSIKSLKIEYQIHKA